MKRILTISILAIMLILMTVTGVNAVSNSELSQKLYNMGAKYGMTAADKVKIDRYLADYPVTESEANQIVAKAQDAVDLMENAGVTDYKKLSSEQKDQLKSLANQAASIAGVTLSFGSGSVEVYKDGKLIETVSAANNGKLAYTGNSNIVLVVSSVAVIALVAVVARKKLANA